LECGSGACHKSREENWDLCTCTQGALSPNLPLPGARILDLFLWEKEQKDAKINRHILTALRIHTRESLALACGTGQSKLSGLCLHYRILIYFVSL
jgi:hypothetical protein